MVGVDSIKILKPSVSIRKPWPRRFGSSRIGLRRFAEFRDGRLIVIMALLRFFVSDFEFFLRIFAARLFFLHLIALLNHRACAIAASRFLGASRCMQQRQDQRERAQARFHQWFSFEIAG